MSTAQVAVTTKSDWTSDQEVRWCPGCGDYGILLAVQTLMPELVVNPENTVYSVKRFMGRKYDDPEVARAREYRLPQESRWSGRGRRFRWYLCAPCERE